MALAVALIEDGAGLVILQRLAEDSYLIGQHAVVKAFSALALGKSASAQATPPLNKLAADADPVVRWHPAVALGETRDPRARPILTTLLQDEVPFVREHAAIALAQMGDAKVYPK